MGACTEFRQATVTLRHQSQQFDSVAAVLEENQVPTRMAQVTMVPQTMTELGDEEAKKMIKLLESFEEDDDVQDVYSNFAMPDDFEE